MDRNIKLLIGAAVIIVLKVSTALMFIPAMEEMLWLLLILLIIITGAIITFDILFLDMDKLKSLEMVLLIASLGMQMISQSYGIPSLMVVSSLLAVASLVEAVKESELREKTS